MKQKMTWIKSIICFVLLLGSAAGANAQVTSHTPPYDTSNCDGVRYFCEDNANRAIDLGMDVVGIVLNLEGGDWYEVDKAGNSLGMTSNLFLLTGKPVGEYYFKYVATNNVCLPTGESKIACVVIVEAPKDFSHEVFSCVGETPSLDLSKIVSPTLDVTGYALDGTYPTGVSITGSSISMDSYEGTIYVTYSVNDPTDLDGTGNDATCATSATITLEVKRGEEPKFVAGSVTYCPETAPNKINLAQLAGITAYENAEWTIKSDPSSSTAPFNNVSLNGSVATFGSTPPALGNYVFTYAWKGYTPAEESCYPEDSQDFTVIITDQTITLPTDPFDNICKALNPNRIYNLTKEGLGLILPESAGKWIPTPADSLPTGATEAYPAGYAVDVVDGQFEVANAKVGVYYYTFIASEVASYCGLSGNTTLKLTVGDNSSSAFDGRVQLCMGDLETATGNLTLSEFVMGMPEGATWSAPTGATIVGTNLDEVAYADLNTLGVGTYEFGFTYNSAGCTENGAGSLYVTVTNNLAISDNIVLSFCRPDMPAEINLKQVIGADLTGVWTVAVDITPATLSTDGIFKENATVGDGAKEYVLTFTPDGSSTCITADDVITVTIKVDDDKF